MLRAVERVKSLPLVELCRVEPVGARGSWWARGKTAADSRLWHLSLEGGKTPVSAQHGGRIPCLPGGQRASNQIIKLSKSLIVRARILTRGISVRILDPVMSAQLADGEPMGACKVRHFKGG